MSTPHDAVEVLALERLAEAVHAQAFAVAWRERRYVEAVHERQQALIARAETNRIRAQIRSKRAG